ncbi:MAG TPA: IlvD/Edd family dehydratase [Bryobacteraceae bacterium]|jgi:dihydroxy-acid dehydratase|nr:IlvD/Edd family dehydratase [Bryobacteraceae bacterium]
MTPRIRRSQEWFRAPNYYGFARRAWLRSEGFPADVFDGRPVVGICNSWSELNNCNMHLRDVAVAVKRGVIAAGGLPLEFPTISLGEMYMKPTSMLFRNLMAMDVEESIRANPLDGVVLLCGCDKTTPAQLMGAASADLPSIFVTGGPMIAGEWRGKALGSGTDGRKIFDLYRTGRISEDELCEVEGCIARTAGHCTVMGTASTMTSLAEALGMTLPGCANIPAPDARRMAIAELSGRRIVEMIDADLRPSRIMTRAAFENAVTTLMALGGSTNAVIHLIAIAGRLGIPLTLADFDRLSRRTPCIVNVKPSGEYLMEDLFNAGGVPAVMNRVNDLLDGSCLTVNGKTIGENIAAAAVRNDSVIRARTAALAAEGGIAILYGNLAPDGAVIKQTAASPELLQHRGKALVFENRDEMQARIDSEDLPVDRHSILVMRNCGPKGAPGMPEWGQIPMPRKLLNQGVTDVVRISDARMSGTSFGTVVLHIAPESAIGGPLAAVRTGDEIELDVANRKLELRVSADQIAARLRDFEPPKPHYTRGYGKLFLDHVTQANLGCDFDFLAADKLDRTPPHE